MLITNFLDHLYKALEQKAIAANGWVYEVKATNQILREHLEKLFTSPGKSFLQWQEINSDNKPQFDKQYLLAKAKKGWFSSEKLYYGQLDRVETYQNNEVFVFKIGQFHDSETGCIRYVLGSNITHFLEVDLPKVGKS